MDEDDGQGEDGAARAFTQLGREVSLLRAAVEGLTAARENIEIPDYEPTLARTEKVLGILAQQIDAVRKSPAMTLTPENMGGRLNASVAEATQELQHQVQSAKSALSSASFDLQNIVASARRGDEQNRWLIVAGVVGLVAGLLLYAVLAGPIVRLAPTSWQWPEKVATRVLAEPSPWDAGQHLMSSSSRQSWEGVVAADRLLRDNRETIDGCREQAAKAKKAVRCTVDVKPEDEP